MKHLMLTAVLTLFTIPCFAQQSYRFVVGKVEANPFSLKAGDPDILYEIVIISDNRRVGDSANASELAPILKFMGLKKPEDLSGLTFYSPMEDPSDALDRLRMQAIHNGKYIPPTPDQFFDILAKGLVNSAREECPKTRDIADSETTFRALSTAFENGCSSLDPKFLESFNQRIRRLSNGTMNISIAESKEFHGMSSTCGGEYLFLNQGDKPIAKFTLGAASNGFVCTKNAAAIASRARVFRKAERQNANPTAGLTTR